jgi:hypothetical protein
MNNIINYLKKSIKPRNDTEFKISDCFDKNAFVLMKQDGLLVINKNKENIDCCIDWVTIGNHILCRKNSPNQIEWLNNDGTFSFDLTSEPIYRRLVPPPWETIDHSYIISNIIIETNGYNKNYIEFGVSKGDSIEIISDYVKNVHGVDITQYEPKKKNINFYCMTTDQFSIDYLPDINYDYAFIDADHSSKQAIIDFENIYKFINIGGYIFLHDTYPCMIENLLPNACNDCYKTPLYIKDKYPTIEIITLPINPGLTIVKKT